VAAVYVALGEIIWAQKAYEERSDYMVYLQTEPLFDSLRADEFLLSVFYTLGAPRDPAKKSFARGYSFGSSFPPFKDEGIQKRADRYMLPWAGRPKRRSPLNQKGNAR
jgi:hypothetical protein